MHVMNTRGTYNIIMIIVLVFLYFFSDLSMMARIYYNVIMLRALNLNLVLTMSYKLAIGILILLILYYDTYQSISISVLMSARC